MTATESSFIKPARLSSQKMITNLFQQSHIGRSPVDVFEFAAARMRALHSFANETDVAVNIRRKGKQVRYILEIDQSLLSRVKLGGGGDLGAPCGRLFKVLGLVHGSHAFLSYWGWGHVVGLLDLDDGRYSGLGRDGQGCCVPRVTCDQAVEVGVGVFGNSHRFFEVGDI